jgi:hypothetical protein
MGNLTTISSHFKGKNRGPLNNNLCQSLRAKTWVFKQHFGSRMLLSISQSSIWVKSPQVRTNADRGIKSFFRCQNTNTTQT